jgi:hypothetical protein
LNDSLLAKVSVGGRKGLLDLGRDEASSLEFSLGALERVP